MLGIENQRAQCRAAEPGSNPGVAYRVAQKYWIAERWVGLVIFPAAVFGFF